MNGTIWLNCDFIGRHQDWKMRLVAFDIAVLLCIGGRAFEWDPEAISAALRAAYPHRWRSARWLRKHEREIKALFVETSAGLYPSTSWLTEGSPEAVDG